MFVEKICFDFLHAGTRIILDFLFVDNKGSNDKLLKILKTIHYALFGFTWSFQSTLDYSDNFQFSMPHLNCLGHP